MRKAINQLFERAYARFIPPALRDPLDEFYRARMLILVCIVSCLLLTPFTILRFWLQGFHVYPVTLCLMTLALLVVPMILKRSSDMSLPGLYLVSVITLGLVIMCFVDGGILSPTVFALLLIPLFAIIFGNEQRGIAATIVTAAAMGLLTLSSLNGWGQPLGFDRPLYDWVFTASAVSVMIILVSMAYLFMQWQKTVHENLITASKAKDEFLSGMSHELRTPLNAMMGFSDVLVHEYAGPLNEEQKQHLQLVIESGEHLTELVEDLVNLTNIDAGKVKLAPEPLDFAALVKHCVGAFEVTAQRKGITIDVNIGDIPETVVADDTRIRQVLNNLIANAIKFSPDNETISIEVTRNGPIIEISVHDRGPGVPPQYRNLIFEKFFQVESALAGKTVGSGLGLYIARRLSELHGGRLNLLPTVAGTTFVLALPVKPTHIRQPAEEVAL